MAKNGSVIVIYYFGILPMSKSLVTLILLNLEFFVK